MPMLGMFFVHRTCARDITCVPPHAYMPHRAYTRDICVQPRLEVRVSTLLQLTSSRYAFKSIILQEYGQYMPIVPIYP